MKKSVLMILCVLVLMSCTQEGNQFGSETNAEKISFTSKYLNRGDKKEAIKERVTSFWKLYEQYIQNPESAANKVMDKKEALLLVEGAVNYRYPFKNVYHGEVTITTAKEGEIAAFREVEENTITLQSAFESLKSVLSFVKRLGIDHKEKIMVCTDLSLSGNILIAKGISTFVTGGVRLPYMQITSNDSWFAFSGGKCTNAGPADDATNAAEKIEDIINHNWRYVYYPGPFNYGDTISYYNVDVVGQFATGNYTQNGPNNFPLISSTNSGLCIPPFPSNNASLNMQSLTNSYKNFVFSTVGSGFLISVDFYSTSAGIPNNSNVVQQLYFHNMQVVFATDYF